MPASGRIRESATPDTPSEVNRDIEALAIGGHQEIASYYPAGRPLQRDHVKYCQSAGIAQHRRNRERHYGTDFALT
eukprot:924809-Amphidinium_carterae.2